MGQNELVSAPGFKWEPCAKAVPVRSTWVRACRNASLSDEYTQGRWRGAVNTIMRKHLQAGSRPFSRGPPALDEVSRHRGACCCDNPGEKGPSNVCPRCRCLSSRDFLQFHVHGKLCGSCDSWFGTSSQAAGSAAGVPGCGGVMVCVRAPLGSPPRPSVSFPFCSIGHTVGGSL